MRIGFIIPCYNEEETIGKIIERIKRLKIPGEKEILVIDDGSTDRSYQIAKNFREVKVIKHDRNRGKGAAIRTGIENSIADIIVIQDADLEYAPEDVPRLIDPIVKGEADIVFGSRFAGKIEDMSFSHFMGNKILSAVTRLLYQSKITDVMTGYKVFKREVLTSMNLSSSSFEVETEIGAKALDSGYKIVEVPISYQRRKEGESKIGWKHGFSSLYTLLKYRLKDRSFQLIILMLLLAGILRVSWLLKTVYFNVSLPPDAQGYLVIGESILRGGGYPAPREPFFPLVAAFFFRVSKPDTISLRVLTVILSLVVLCLTYSVAQTCLRGSWERFLPMFLVATDFYLIYNSVRGLREELYTVIILFFLLLLINWNRIQSPRLRYGAAGFLAVSLYLTKLEGLVVALALVAFLVWHGSAKTRKLDIRLITVMLVSSAVAVACWIISCRILFNDPFATTTAQGSWWYWFEFGERKEVTAFQYLFGYHSPLRIAVMTVSGAWNLLFKLVRISTLNPLGFPLLLLGFIFSLRREKLLPLHFILVGGPLSMLPFFALDSEYRLYYPYLPLVYVFVAYAVSYLKEKLPPEKYSFRLFHEWRINLSIYQLTLVPVLLMALAHITVLIYYFQILSWQIVFTPIALILTLTSFFLYYRWRN